MSKTEKVFLVISIVLMFLILISYFGIGAWEQVSLIPHGKYIESSPELSWIGASFMSLIGAFLISAFAWSLALTYRLEKK